MLDLTIKNQCYPYPPGTCLSWKGQLPNQQEATVPIPFGNLTQAFLPQNLWKQSSSSVAPKIHLILLANIFQYNTTNNASKAKPVLFH